MLISTPLETHVRAQLLALRGNDFQDFIVKLLFLVHGTDGFQDLRRTGDQGSDGLIRSEQRSVACYGPDEKKFAAFKKKIDGDYAAYKKNWLATHPHWRVYINRDPSPEETRLVGRLHKDGQLWGVTSVMETIRSLPWHQSITLFRILQIDESLIGRDFLQPMLSDLVSERVDGDAGEYGKRAPEIEAKIRANYAEHEIDEAIGLATLTFEQQAAADAALKGYDDSDLNRIKLRVKSDFSSTPSTASFGDRFNALMQRYVDQYNAGNDDGLTFYIRGLVTVLFAQCIFGVKPRDE